MIPSLCNIDKPLRYQPAVGLLEFMRQVGNPNLINMAAGVPDPAMLPLPVLRKAFAEANKRYAGSMWAYQTPEGHVELRQHIAKRMQQRGVKVDAGGIIMTTGCTQALKVALGALVKKGDVVACENPAYYNLLEQIHDLGAKVLPLPTDMNRGLLPAAAEPLLRKYRPKCLVVCSSLSNPTGATMSQAARRQLLQLCRQLGIVIVEDDIYAELLDGGAPKPIGAYATRDEVIIVSSFCKSVAPGLRVGYIIPGKWHEQVARAKCNMDMHCSTVAEAILASFLAGKEFDRHLIQLRKISQARRKLVRDALLEYLPAGSRVSQPQGGFLLWVELPFAVDLPQWNQRAMRAGVSFAMGNSFLTAQAQRGCLRLNCVRASERNLIKGVKLLAETLQP